MTARMDPPGVSSRRGADAGSTGSGERAIMLRQCLAVLVGLGLTSAAPAATWAEGLFEELSHDFGPTPRGPVLIHHYRLTNNTQSTVHVSNVRVSCGCTQATVMHGTL